MNKDAVRTHIHGMLIEEGQDMLDIAKRTEKEILEFVIKAISDDDKNKKAAKALGLTLASLEFESMFE